MTKKQLIQDYKALQKQGFNFLASTSRNKETIRIVVDHEDMPDISGYATLEKQDDDLYELSFIEIEKELRGNGKLLVYYAMDHIYPAYLCNDTSGCTELLARVWGKMDTLDYVEKQKLDDGVNMYGDAENDGDVMIWNKYRFNFKK